MQNNENTMSIEKHRVDWEPFKATDGHIYVFPSVRVLCVQWERYNAVVRQVCQVECDCVTLEHAAREFFLAFHDGVFDRGELDETDYQKQTEIARGYIHEYLDTTCPQPCVGFANEPVWGDCY